MDLRIRRGTGTADIHLRGNYGSTSIWQCDYEGDVRLLLMDVEGESLLVGPGEYVLGTNYNFYIETAEPAHIWSSSQESGPVEYDSIVTLYTGSKTDGMSSWTSNYPEYPSDDKCCVVVYEGDHAWENPLGDMQYGNDGAFFTISGLITYPIYPELPDPTPFDPMSGTFTIAGQYAEPVAVERTHWGAIKNLYR